MQLTKFKGDLMLHKIAKFYRCFFNVGSTNLPPTLLLASVKFCDLGELFPHIFLLPKALNGNPG